MPKSTALLLAWLSLAMNSTLTCSLVRKFKIKSHTLSVPTAVKSAVLSPSLLQPTAILSGDPPTKASKPLISTKSAPMLWEYRSIEDLPIVITSIAGFTFPIFIYLAETMGMRESFPDQES